MQTSQLSQLRASVKAYKTKSNMISLRRRWVAILGVVNGLINSWRQNAIKDLIGERFDLANAKRSAETTVVPSVEQVEPAEPAPQTNGHHSPSSSPSKREAESDETSDLVDTSPPKKKQKSTVDADAALAAKLQAEEDKLTRPRRGGVNRKAAPAKKKKKKKTKEKVTGSDDSEIDGEEKEQKPKRETGFHVCFLSDVTERSTNRCRNRSIFHLHSPISLKVRHR